MDIRPYKPADAPAISALRWRAVQTLAPRAYSPAQIRAWLPEPDSVSKTRKRCEDGRDVWVAIKPLERRVGEVIMGVTDLEANGHVDTLYVDPDFSGKGVGSCLLAHVERIARDRGLARLFTEASELARPVFARAGYDVMERREFLLRGTLIYNYAMVKALSI